MTRLMGLQFRVVYRNDKENLAADALSRVSHLMAQQAVSEVKPIWVQEILNAYATDTRAQQLLAQLAVQSPDEHDCCLEQGIIKHHGKVWISHNSALQTKIVVVMHSSTIVGHSGVKATYQRLKHLFSWKGVKSYVGSFVTQCQVCQHAKHENTHPAGLLQPLPVPQGVWQDVTMDFIKGLALSDGYNTILVVVDRYTKYAHFCPIKHPFTVASIARVVLDNIVKLHGLYMIFHQLVLEGDVRTS